ncbi:protein-disulfide reductase DsbD family protein [Akkermansiaceae bacterium]|nr:protein-disulfide reductase DsbD family protein [Akkermansiaceae bacterium]MDB4319083.1 protein-disulfide reductase DsbD family protein [bacterium]MDA7863285.1 protein-disulfide reductase DsbD family protein [Akkermansiaceae bacterium]MDB4301310.1 protein-disulfide reductase DsbD family protein [Akkermansiaceae bacterium]MDB4412250.1 protein-disulfide reductase DsbD family protein [Akkermansiaceae bacterium]
MTRSLFFILLALIPLHLFGQDPFGVKQTSARVTPAVSAIEPGDYFRIAFTLDHEEHFHTYYKNGGVVGFPPSVDWDLPEGFTAGELIFPQPTALKTKASMVNATAYGYEGIATFIVEIEASEDLKIGAEFDLKGTFDWQECNESACIQGEHDFAFKVTVAEETQPIEPNEEFFEEARAKLPQDSSSWGALASNDGDSVTLEVIFPEGLEINDPVYFFSHDGQIDSQAPQKGGLKGDRYHLTLKRNLGNKNLGITATDAAEELPGLFTFNDGFGPASVELKATVTGEADAAAGVGHTAFVPATPADREAGLAVYDIDARPEAVLLGGATEKKVTFLSSLGLVFLGGLILNLMPCVFPVLGLKIMGFVAQAGEDESKIKIHGMFFGLGLLIAMWILAAVIISLKLDWGQQLSNPVFLGTMIIVFFLMGLNLYGLFEFGSSMTSVGGELQSKKGYSGSFFSGVLTTLVATPCSGPFLGAVMAFALSQDSYAIQFAIFTVFGLGIASPYIILSLFPALIKKLPRPGAWMETFKQVMAFFVFATVVFFMKGYLKLVGDDHFNIFLFALCLIGLGAYLYGRYATPAASKTKRLVTGYGLAGLMLVGGITWAYSTAKPPKPGLAWNEWYPGIMELSRPKKRIIWVDYTADW